MNFTAIDFETANAQRDSACALGMVRVEHGQIVEEKSWLICPPELYFNNINVQIHGIRPSDVMHQPHFSEIWHELLPYLENEIVLAHNASFDFSVLRACMNTYNITYPKLEYLCSVQISRLLWPQLENHKLDTMANFFRFPLKHHDAMDDTRACARITLEACRASQSNGIKQLTDQLKIRPGKIDGSGYRAPKKLK